MQHILSLSYGKDSLACLAAIELAKIRLQEGDALEKIDPKKLKRLNKTTKDRED